MNGNPENEKGKMARRCSGLIEILGCAQVGKA